MSKYLQRYAETETALLQNWPGNYYRRALIIPCYRESADFLLRLLKQFNHQQLLIVLVVNQPDTDYNPLANEDLLDAINKIASPIWQIGHLSLRPWGEDCGLLLIERWQDHLRLPRKQGVGLARKIGCDIAARLIADGFVAEQWLHSTDADAELPADYFHNLPCPQKTSAALYPFVHLGGDREVQEAVQLYEQALHYYVNGLQWAGSPWAFHTIGSILAISANYYCLARGFPRKSAGEDFYLLNKLAKLAPVVSMAERAPVRIQARLSDRVPFGTGPATAKIARQLAEGEKPLWYAPAVFTELSNFLQWANAADTQIPAGHRWSAALGELSWEDFAVHCRQQKLQGARKNTAFRHWFDAFRTLRFIHLMQRQYHPAQPLAEVLTRAEFDFSPRPACTECQTTNRQQGK